MLHYLWMVPALPLLGSVLLLSAGARLPRSVAAWIGAGSVGLSAVVTLGIAGSFLSAPPAGHVFVQTLWSWIAAGPMEAKVAFHLDALSLVMIGVVTGVGFLIHVYSIEYMRDDPDVAQFFARMNLFVAAMLILVLADNLLLLFLGWEGVGLCSYLLIGFWYKEPANCAAATKAFVVTRVGDVAMALGCFLIFWQLGTLHIQTALENSRLQWLAGAPVAVAAALLLLGGAVGKSGQLPLQVWLPDAMAGPTPVSALIHAATMVTAGVYLIARMHPIFEAAPQAQHLVAVVGAATLLLAACAAAVQRDIKRALAYSTISQVGYMFLALGVGGWAAGMFHFMTHAIFKALLFMAAGWIILSLHHEQDMFKMGGVRKSMPVAFWTFLAGAASLMALPLVTAGFYSKDYILWEVFVSPQGGVVLWLAGVAGAGITALYTTRMLLLIFFKEGHAHAGKQPGLLMAVPLAVLAVLATVAGFLELPRTLGHWPAFSHFLETAVPPAPEGHYSIFVEIGLQLLTELVVAAGIVWALALHWWGWPVAIAVRKSGPGEAVHALWTDGWGFDLVYEHLLVRPLGALSRLLRGDPVEGTVGLVVWCSQQSAGVLSLVQTGQLRWYMTVIALGAVATIAIVVLL